MAQKEKGNRQKWQGTGKKEDTSKKKKKKRNGYRGTETGKEFQ
jgi:hypothetical protein